MDRVGWRATVHGHRELGTTEPLTPLLCAFGLPFLSFLSPVLSLIRDPVTLLF